MAGVISGGDLLKTAKGKFRFSFLAEIFYLFEIFVYNLQPLAEIDWRKKISLNLFIFAVSVAVIFLVIVPGLLYLFDSLSGTGNANQYFLNLTSAIFNLISPK